MATAVSHPPSFAASAPSWLATHARLLEAQGLQPSAHALATSLAQALNAERVAVGCLLGEHLRLAGESGLEHVEATLDRALAAAMHEAMDQRATVSAPTVASPTRVLRVQHAHERIRAGAHVVSVPLVAGDQVVGAITLWRASSAPWTAHELQTLSDVAAFAAPVLQLKRDNEQSLWARWRQSWAAKDASAQLRRTRTAAGLAAAVVVLLLLPLSQGVGGRARVEGAMQRVLVAPSDGFLAQVHARPGEQVRAGQVLVAFSQHDLLLDRARWTSQLEQHENGSAAANARRDRAQLVVSQARASEAMAQLDLVESRLARSSVVAPFDGIVVRGDLSQQLGAPVQQGAELMTLAPMGSHRLIVEVDERDIAAVTVGMEGSVTLAAMPWDAVRLRVLRITPIATAVEGANVFEVEAELLESRADLRPGLQGQARLNTGREPLAWRGLRRMAALVRLQLWTWWG
jgi:biotin carboxyl carrier protein